MGTADSFGLLNRMSLVSFGLLNQLFAKQVNQKAAHLMNHVLLSQLRSPISASPFAWLSENIDAVRAFETDPLTGFAFTNNGWMTLFALMQRAMRPDWYTNMPSNYPILLISGNNDPVGKYGSRHSKHYKKKLIHANCSVSVQLYPNMRHEPLHEKQAQKSLWTS